MLTAPTYMRDDLEDDEFEDADAAKARIDWSLLGHRVCIRRLLAILGTHPRTFYKHANGHLDKRAFNAKPTSTSGLSVDQFFLELWLSAAERFPEDGIECAEKEIVFGEEPEVPNPESKYPAPAVMLEHIPHWDPSCSLLGEMATLGSGAALQPKYIQHQRLMDLWWQYLGWVSERCPPEFKPASYSTFWRRWHWRWRQYIKIRKHSQHAQCTVCFEYSHQIHHSRTGPEDKQAIAKRWHIHLKEQYRDRLIYWNIRFWSRRPESNVLSIIIDSMDKAKAAWPQYVFRKSKELDKYRRPRLVITCVIAHGYCTDFYLADDETMFHGASMFCELLTRMLERVRNICESRGQSFPEHLVVQSDNTTAQAKNAECVKFLAVLVRKFKFHTIVLNFLRVGHTHEDVDQMFAVLLSLVLRRIQFQRPCELCDAIQVAMQNVIHARGEELLVSHLTHIRDFKAWMDVCHVGPEGCFLPREGIDAPHSFIFKLRMDLSYAELQLLESNVPRNTRRFTLDPLDVFCLTKHFMSDTVVDPPTLLIPNERFDRLSAAPGVSCDMKSMSPQRQVELQHLADALEKMSAHWENGHSYFRAAQELRLLVLGRDAHASTDRFLQRPSLRRQVPALAGNNPYFGNLPGVNWRMRVTFGR